MKCIAVDGPSGAGKSTIARNIAKNLGYIYVDTGALYRAIGFYLIDNNIDLNNINKIIEILPLINIEIKFINSIQNIYLNNKNITNLIRTSEISMATSCISSITEIREFLLNIQKEIGEKSDVIMDGRDIGTVVFPNADIKIFLTASLEERAKRRYKQMSKKGNNISYDSVLHDMKIRDHNDCTREISPLKQSEDYIFVETTGYTLEKSITIITKIIKDKLDYGVL